MNLKYISNLLLIGAFASFVGLTCYHTQITDTEQFSFYENRNLALPPTYTKDAFWTGTYCAEWETYLKEHIAEREWMLEQYALVSQNILKKPVIGNTLESSDGKKLLPLLSFNQENNQDVHDLTQEMASRLSTLNDAVNRYGGTFLYVGIPEQNVYFEQDYPFFTGNPKASYQMMQSTFFHGLYEHGISFLDMGQVFDDMGHPDWIYNTTDHHYNYYGAFYTYQAIMQTINQGREQNLPVLTDSDLDFQTLPNPFMGSRNRKRFGQFTNEDVLVIGVPKQSIPFQRYIMGNEADATLYDIPKNPNAWVTYDCYNGGNRAECIIETNRKELPTLLLFGDSFTNPLETLLYTGFDKSIYVDLRETNYLTQGILAYVQQYHPDYVICVRNSNQYLDLNGNGMITYEVPSAVTKQ